MSYEVFDSHQVIRPGGHHRERIQIKPDNVGQNLLQQLAFVEGAFLAVSFIPAANPIDRHDEEGSRAAGWIKKTLVRITFVPEFVQNMICQPIGGVVLAQIVPHGFRKQLLIKLL